MASRAFNYASAAAAVAAQLTVINTGATPTNTAVGGKLWYLLLIL
jgi:hypothetical protein